MGKQKTSEHKNPLGYKGDLIDLSIILTRIREVSGLSQDDLAVKSGVEKYTISNIENASGSPTLKTVSKIFDALGYSVADAYAQIQAFRIRYDG